MSILMMISHAKTKKGAHLKPQANKPHMCVRAELIEIDDNRIFSSFHSIQSIQSDLIIALIQQQQFLIYENHVETAVVVLRLLALLILSYSQLNSHESE
jgi:hypothetical protein